MGCWAESKLKEEEHETMNVRSPLLAIAVLTPLTILAAPKDEWRGWRGPTSNGVAADGQEPVTSWSDSESVLWKANVPGRGHSSPIVVSDLVVLTTADEASAEQSVVAYDRKTGQRKWKTSVHRGGLAKKIHKKNTHASPTIASDGKMIYASFCNSDAVQISAITLKGKKRWTKNTGPFIPKLYQFGYAPSPILYGKALIVSSDFEDGFLAAFATSNGREIWRTPRRSNHVSYSSPIVGKVAGRDQLFISGRETVSSYNPKNGKLLWSVPATTKATCGTIVWEKDVVFASGGYPKAGTFAIKADGSKKILWNNTQKCYEQSMLVHDGHVYAFNDNGIAICWRASDGEEMWKQRLRGPVSASPTLANGNIYATNERGTTFVFKAVPTGYEEVARNQLGDSSFASPTICGGRIYLRHASGHGKDREETLYCLGKK